jgi:hypothetical protein
MSEKLKSLKRHYKALKNLRGDMHNMVHMDTYRGQGELLVRTYISLHKAINELVNDPVIEALTINLPEDAKEREKAMQVVILVGQLSAHVEAIIDEWREEAGEDSSEETDDRGRRHMRRVFGND